MEVLPGRQRARAGQARASQDWRRELSWGEDQGEGQLRARGACQLAQLSLTRRRAHACGMPAGASSDCVYQSRAPSRATNSMKLGCRGYHPRATRVAPLLMRLPAGTAPPSGPTKRTPPAGCCAA